MPTPRDNPTMRVPRSLHPYVRKLCTLYALQEMDEVIEAIAKARSFGEAIDPLLDAAPKAPKIYRSKSRKS